MSLRNSSLAAKALSYPRDYW